MNTEKKYFYVTLSLLLAIFMALGELFIFIGLSDSPLAVCFARNLLHCFSFCFSVFGVLMIARSRRRARPLPEKVRNAGRTISVSTFFSVWCYFLSVLFVAGVNSDTPFELIVWSVLAFVVYAVAKLAITVVLHLLCSESSVSSHKRPHRS